MTFFNGDPLCKFGREQVGEVKCSDTNCIVFRENLNAKKKWWPAECSTRTEYKPLWQPLSPGEGWKCNYGVCVEPKEYYKKNAH